MKILLTGCAGFIGSHVLDRLLADGHTVLGVDNFDPFYSRALKNANIEAHLDSERFDLVEGDLAEPETYTKIKFLAEGLQPSNTATRSDAKQGGTSPRPQPDAPAIKNQQPTPQAFDAIIHLAAKAGVRPSIEDPVGYQRANVIATQHLLEFARQNDIKPFVFASSSSVYGINPEVPWSEEIAGLRPISPYAGTKVSGELLGHVYSHLFGIRFLALRFFTVYGPRQRPDLAIHKFARRILEGQSIPVFGDGSTRRDYTYIDDTVEGILGALHYEGSDYEIINLGNDRTVSLAEMISEIEDALGKQAVIDRRPEQPGDVPQTWANIEKARRVLGYEPKTGFKEGVRTFTDWLRHAS